MAINYTGVDLDRYDQGNRFLSQDRFLANYSPRDAITFNVSPNMNTGIFGPGINPFPIIPMYGDSDGGGGPIGPRDLGEITSDVGFGNLNDQTGMGYTLTEEDKAEIAAQKNKNRLTQAAQLGLFALNPAGYIMSKGIKAGYDKIFGGGNEGGGDGGGNKVTTTDYYSPGGGYEGSDEQDRDNEAAADTAATAGDAPGYSGPTTFEYGGRVGYKGGNIVQGIMGLFKPSTRVGFRSRKDIPLEQYSKMEAPITTKMMEEIPESELKKIFRTQELGLYSETPEILKAGNLMQRFTKKVGGKRVIDYEKAEDILNVRLRGDETLDELFEIEFRTRPVERAYGGIVGMYR